MADPDVMKEILREAYMAGALDLGVDSKFLDGFVRIFAGEMEAILAVSHASYLELADAQKLMDLASPNAESVRHFKAFQEGLIS